ncbi:hypothetical protein Y1Q_0006083 [Alligator mississippiensis]|uniref:Uncharacterized protein n=1 Tax=Alligator mississippiensis TaxID=8496 RepID=A0A151N3Z6_ALLMI|nr:hypothetical protein Y1Q_0006083 [Alligator mississippiensis]
MMQRTVHQRTRGRQQHLSILPSPSLGCGPDWVVDIQNEKPELNRSRFQEVLLRMVVELDGEEEGSCVSSRL